MKPYRVTEGFWLTVAVAGALILLGAVVLFRHPEAGFAACLAVGGGSFGMGFVAGSERVMQMIHEARVEAERRERGEG